MILVIVFGWPDCIHAGAGKTFLPPCYIVGPSTVNFGETITFTASSCTIAVWTADCATVVSQTASSVTVLFDQAGCTTATINATKTAGGMLASWGLTVNPAVPLAGGTVSSSFQPIDFGTAPSTTINASAATNGSCSGNYVYQWYSSTDNTNFSAISGTAAQGATYQTPVLYMTTYFKRMVTCGAATAFTTNTITITVNGPSTGVGPASNYTGNVNLNMNWVLESNYDASGKIVSQGKNFFDNSGVLLQTQNKVMYRRDDNVVFPQVLATQPMYDVYGRPAASTLPAPIDYTEFSYSPNFIQATDGSAYTYKNFDKIKPVAAETDKTNAPDPIGGQAVKGTLGWYYGQNNTWEPYLPTTNYPYTRQTYYQDGTNNLKKIGGAGETFRMGGGHEGSTFLTPVMNELDNYKNIRNQFFNTSEIGELQGTFQSQVIQLVSRDGQGNENIVIQDKSGKTLISGRPGIEYLPPSNIINVSAVVPITYNQGITITNGSNISVQSTVDGNNLNVYLINTAGIMTGVYNGSIYSLPHNVNLGSGTLVIESDAPFTISYTNGGVVYTLVKSDNINEQNIGSAGYFKIFDDNTAVTVTGDYSLTDMSTEQSTSLLPGNILNKGYYKITANTGYASLTYANGYSDLSYNFYNQLGQLVASIAPEGVKKLYGTYTYTTKAQLPYTTLYSYDMKGRLVSTTSPDGGTTTIIYRLDGRIRFSQNAVQAASGTGKFSYINYDENGRSFEAGEYQPDASGIVFNSPAMFAILGNTSNTGGLTSGVKRDVIITIYDVPDNSYSANILGTYVQDPANLGGASSSTLKYSSITNNVPVAGNIVSQTWYNYDEEGKIVWQIQMMQNAGGGTLYKTIDYTYDALGRVERKIFQKNASAETFVHYYKYDPANQQLWKIYTNTSNVTPGDPVDPSYKLQATYRYYLHGGVKRLELAGQLQGIDYTYTLQGALKAINNNKRANDPGGDGSNGFAQDAFGEVLDYFTDDYKNSRTSGIQPINGVAATDNYYMGNIKAMSWYSEKPAIAGLTDDPVTYIYKYDNKYQLTESSWGTGLVFSATQGVASTFTTTTMNSEKVLDPALAPGYDANGNIRYLQRTSPASNLQDKFEYSYNGTNNRLQSVVNTVTGVPVTYANYTYNESGQLIREDNSDPNKVKYIQYDVSGKVVVVAKDAGFSLVQVKYVYDETGKRIQKILYNTGSNQIIQVTYYFDDVVYVQNVSGGVYPTPLAQEYAINGANRRLGVYYRQGTPIYAYQLTDHLGNVRAVIAQNASTFTVRMYTDYYPFGMEIAKAGTNDYRYGYQGGYSEKDGETDWNSFILRMYDSRIGRWLQFDPKMMGFSPYIGMGNNPVILTDPDGGDPSTDVIENADGSYTTVASHPYDNDNNIYVVDKTGKRTGEIIGQTRFPFSFANTNDATGAFEGVAKVTFRLYLMENGQSIYNHFTTQWKAGVTPIAPYLVDMALLALLSKNKAYYDIKDGYDNFYTPVMYQGLVTTVRELGNIIFGANMRYINHVALDQIFTTPDQMYRDVMPVVGKFNQKHNGGNGYNPTFPFFGEHTYSGSNIFYGYFGYKPF